jgi:hypothetical protein
MYINPGPRGGRAIPTAQDVVDAWGRLRRTIAGVEAEFANVELGDHDLYWIVATEINRLKLANHDFTVRLHRGDMLDELWEPWAFHHISVMQEEANNIALMIGSGWYYGHYYVFPVPGRGVTLGEFGLHNNPSGRDAVDIFARQGTIVVAPISGVLTIVKDLENETEIIIRGDDGINYYFTHMVLGSPASFGIQQNNQVSAGQPIGRIGGAGGYHVHFSAADPCCQNVFPTCGTADRRHCRTDRHAGTWLSELLPRLPR